MTEQRRTASGKAGWATYAEQLRVHHTAEDTSLWPKLRALLAAAQTLRVGLAAHMRHEEDAALPLVASYLGRQGWTEFGQQIRQVQGGLRTGASYLPWVLDDATAEMQRKVPAQLPLPARVLYRRVWEPKYHRTTWWDGAAET